MSTREHHEVFGVRKHVRGHIEPRKIRNQDELGIFVDLGMHFSNQPWRSSWHWHFVKVNFIQRLWAFSFSAVGKNNFKLEWCRRRWISSLPFIYFKKCSRVSNFSNVCRSLLSTQVILVTWSEFIFEIISLEAAWHNWLSNSKESKIVSFECDLIELNLITGLNGFSKYIQFDVLFQIETESKSRFFACTFKKLFNLVVFIGLSLKTHLGCRSGWSG